jgi:hypothetical protein
MLITPHCGGALCGLALALVVQLLQPTPLRLELLASLLPASSPTAAAVKRAAPSLPPPPQPNAQAAAPQATDDR